MDSKLRSTRWSVTINNPVAADDECLNLARQKRWKVHGQKEIGEQGTPHYQLAIETPQVRFSAVKKVFPRAHIEVAKDWTALMKYVQKEDTRVDSIPEQEEKFPTLTKTYDMFVDFICERRIRECRYNDDSRVLTVLNDVDGIAAWTNDDVVIHFDSFCSRCIEDGYFVEQWAVNPQVRSALMKFGKSILQRHAARLDSRRQKDRQTNRQTDDLATELNIPTIHNSDAIDQEETSSEEETNSQEGDVTPDDS